ncbi:MAG: hypothetical protein ACOY0R_01825, partial [Chloroflexota bacterium]
EGQVKGDALSSSKGRRSKVGMWQVETGLGQVSVSCGHSHAVGERVALLLKPSDAGLLTVTTTVEDVVFQREQFKVELRGGLFIHLKDAPRVGESLSVTFDVECLS